MPASGADSAVIGLVTDAAANVYVASYTDGSLDGHVGSGDDGFAMKFDANGRKQ